MYAVTLGSLSPFDAGVPSTDVSRVPLALKPAMLAVSTSSIVETKQSSSSTLASDLINDSGSGASVRPSSGGGTSTSESASGSSDVPALPDPDVPDFPEPGDEEWRPFVDPESPYLPDLSRPTVESSRRSWFDKHKWWLLGGAVALGVGAVLVTRKKR